ncbi:MAG: hypothetical protein IPM56_18105 [Ignavibacteriales bacterium]|nr:MAG: hypothetical protein IPM56_18105 [Ignavibacteriales bacterium]
MVAIVECGKKIDNKLPEVLGFLNQEFKITENEFTICKADKIILIGEGEACEGAKKLNMLNLYSVLRVIKKPILGIDLGMELMTENILNDNIAGLGIFPYKSERKENDTEPEGTFKEVDIIGSSILFNNIEDHSKFLFKEKYFMNLNEMSTSSADNGSRFTASIEKGKAYGVQFHPEVSGEPGITLIKNFLDS